MSDISVQLPDGNALAVPDGSTVLSVAEKIGPGLAKAAVVGCIDGQLVDLRLPFHEDVSLEIVTLRDPEAGEVLGHSAEHVMADAVKRLFTEAQVDAGRIDHADKFQYDFLVDQRFTPEDIERIEKEMRNILDEGLPIEREAETQKTPLMLVVGEEEAEAGTVTPRLRREKKQSQGAIGVDALMARLVEDIAERRVKPMSGSLSSRRDFESLSDRDFE